MGLPSAYSVKYLRRKKQMWYINASMWNVEAQCG